MEKLERTHYINMDILRIVASFMVVMLHVAADQWYKTDVTTNEWIAMNFYDSAVRSCVPIFFMLSGKLFLGREQMKPISKIFKNNILKLAVLYVVWSLLYTIDMIGVKALFTAQSNLGKITQLIIDGKYHMWFIPAMIGVYLLAPLMFSLKEHENGKYVFYVLVMFFIFAIILTTIKLIPSQTSYAVGILNKIQYELAGFSGYFLLGHYLSEKKYPRIRKLGLLAILMVVITASTIIGQVHAISRGEPTGILYGYMTLPVFLEAVLIFIIFLKIKLEIPAKASKFITCIAKCTLGIYLVHPFIIEYLKKGFGITTVSFNTWFSIPIISATVFAIGAIMIFVLSKIPVVNKWLI